MQSITRAIRPASASVCGGVLADGMELVLESPWAVIALPRWQAFAQCRRAETRGSCRAFVESNRLVDSNCRLSRRLMSSGHNAFRAVAAAVREAFGGSRRVPRGDDRLLGLAPLIPLPEEPKACRKKQAGPSSIACSASAPDTAPPHWPTPRNQNPDETAKPFAAVRHLCLARRLRHPCGQRGGIAQIREAEPDGLRVHA